MWGKLSPWDVVKLEMFAHAQSSDHCPWRAMAIKDDMVNSDEYQRLSIAATSFKSS